MENRSVWGALALAESTLKNLAVGLHMWAKDHAGGYPETLQELVPTYLRQIPIGPSGKADWHYLRTAEVYELSVSGHPFAAVGLNAGQPAFVDGALQPPSTVPRDRLYSKFALAPELEGWQDVSRGPGPAHWRKGKQDLSFRLSGPPILSATAHEWIEHCVREAVLLPGTVIEEDQPCTFGELSGWELWGRFRTLKLHRLFLSDGALVWEFAYVAPEDEFDDAVDAAMISMIEQRTSF